MSRLPKTCASGQNPMGHDSDLPLTGVTHWHQQGMNLQTPYQSSETRYTKRALANPATVAAETELGTPRNRRCRHLPRGLPAKYSHSRAGPMLAAGDAS